MNVDLAMVDYWASSGRTVWHQTSAGAKLVLALATIGAAIFSKSLSFLALLYALVWVLVIWSRLPLNRVIWLAIYPALFSAVFILSRWDGTWITPLVFLLRALTAGLVAVWLVGTTPYPDLFAPISRVTPRLLGDALFLTYRAFFSLVEKIVHLAVALRLRGGFSRGGVGRELRNVGEGLGTLVLFATERSQRVYAVMGLRGHSGRICGCRHWVSTTRFDVVAVFLAALVIVGANWFAGATP